MTAMDGGNAVFAGAKNCPCHRVIPYILYIAALCHPWHRVIPFILNIKKPGYALAHRVLIFHFSKNTN